MKKLIRIASLILIIVLGLSQFAFAGGTTDTKITSNFTDVIDKHWAFEGIEKLTKAGIVKGYPDGTFKPDGYITRAELVKIANLVFSYTQKQENTVFTDINNDDWFYDHVLIAQKAGYIIGYPDGTFKPNGLITRQELCKVLDSINSFVELPFDKTPVDEISSWAAVYVKKVISNRIMTPDSDNKFRATEKATRAEVCDALAKFIVEEEPVTVTPPDGFIPKDDLYETMDTVIRRLSKGVIPNLTSDAQKEIINDIISNMNEYKSDNSHDYEASAKAAYEKYNKLSKDEQTKLKEQIQIQNTTSDLLKLKNFFFPDIDI